MRYVKNWATDVSNVSLFLRRRKTIKALEVFKFKERIIRNYFYKKRNWDICKMLNPLIEIPHFLVF